jgi:hypothetical protein
MSNHAGYDSAALWEILVETVRALPMYKYHKRYVERSVLPGKPRITPKEMALLLNIPLGEAIVILEELRPATEAEAEAGFGSKAEKPKSLLDYTNK